MNFIISIHRGLFPAVLRSWVIAISCCFIVNANAGHDLYGADDVKYQHGKKVYGHYCSRCHGEHADGRGRATPLYVKMKSARPSNFNVKFFAFRPTEYLTGIIRDGGGKHSLSEYMPPFGGELSAEQISHVVYFIRQVSHHAGINTTRGKTAQLEKEK